MGEFLSNILPLLAVIYFVYKRVTKKVTKNKNVSGKPAQSARQPAKGSVKDPVKKPAKVQYTVPPPLPFDQAAPIVPGSLETAGSDHRLSDAFEGTIFTEDEAPVTPKREATLPVMVQEKSQSPKPVSPHPAPRVIPEFSRSALVQAVVAKEILTRPLSAARRFQRPGQRAL